MKKKVLRQYLVGYNNLEGQDEAVHEYLKIKIRATLGKHALDNLLNVVYKNNGKYFLPYGQAEHLVQLFGKD